MTLISIEAKVKEVTGVDSASRGSTMLHRAVAERLRMLGLTDIAEYTRRVENSEKELQSLIDELMVTETWFFRDREPFIYLADFVQQNWLTGDMSRKLRVLSLPCATGEEPYSIAMMLLQSGLHREQFKIDAVDISTRALRYAKRAVYGRHSFRGETDLIVERFFQRRKNGFSVQENIRNTVEFHHCNFWETEADGFGYDIIFCRNLLIYFDIGTQQKAVAKLHDLLAKDGLLMVGHAETLCVTPGAGFATVRRDGAFAYRKLAKTQTKPQTMLEDQPPPPEQASQTHLYIDLETELLAQRPVTKQPQRSAVKRVVLNIDQAERYELEQAQRHLDDGCIEEAAVICREHLRRFPDSAQAYYLLGLCSEHDGLLRLAAKLFKRAIGLEPSHYQALMRLVATMEQLGDLVSASIYKEKARRIIFGEKRTVPEA